MAINNHLVWTNNPNTSAIGVSKGSKWKKKNQMNSQGDQSGNEIQKNHLGISVDENSQWIPQIYAGYPSGRNQRRNTKILNYTTKQQMELCYEYSQMKIPNHMVLGLWNCISITNQPKPCHRGPCYTVTTN